MNKKYIIEVRKRGGYDPTTVGNPLDSEAEKVKRKEHPYLFSKPNFNIDNLCYYMSFGRNPDGTMRNKPSGPTKLDDFMKKIGICYREKYW